MIRTVVLESQTLFRLGVISAFKGNPDISVAGDAKGGADLFKFLDRRPADVALLGINQSNHSECIEVARRLRNDYPNMKILAVAGEDTGNSVQSLMNAGINGYIGKRQAGRHELTKAIQKVAEGGEYIGEIVVSG
ncbi:MAG: response regulator transcription factor [Marinilabiliaceae bacterium]|nr:response regulator transcription factor [Marinilabiliaceae bacterium]